VAREKVLAAARPLQTSTAERGGGCVLPARGPSTAARATRSAAPQRPSILEPPGWLWRARRAGRAGV
jgi:hypothetical protein